MKRLRRAIDAAILTWVVKPLTRRLLANMRRSAMDQARTAVSDRAHAVSDRARAVLPEALLESPALVALTTRMLPPQPPSRDRRDLLRGLLLAAIVAVAATSIAFAIAALLRSRRRSRTSATATTSGPVVIPVSTAVPEAQADQAGVGAAEELRAISSIGPEVSERLRDQGITSLEQIAGWGPDDIRDIAEQLGVSVERIEREDWVGQARALVASSASTTTA